MTERASEARVLPLRNWPGRTRFWLIVLAFGFPAVIILVAFGIAFAQRPPTPPLLLAPAFALAVSGLATLWILRALRRVGVALDRDALVLDGGVARRTFKLAGVRSGGLRVVDLGEHTELRPVLRTWGIGMPGLASGWFRLRNGAKAFCILTGRERVTVLKADDGTWILLSLVDASVLRAALSS
jgi:hypothetical protein